MKCFTILLIGFLVVLPGCRRKPSFEDELKYSATHTIDEARELLGVTFEIANPPDFVNDKIKVAGEDIELRSLSRSGRYVLGQASRNIPVVWDTHEETMTALNTGHFEIGNFSLFGIDEYGKVIGASPKQEVYQFGTDEQPIKISSTSVEELLANYDWDIHFTADQVFISIENIEVVEVDGMAMGTMIVQQPLNDYIDKILVLDQQQKSLLEIPGTLRIDSIAGVNSKGTVVGMNDDTAVAYNKEFKLIASVDPNRHGLKDPFGGRTDAKFFSTNDNHVLVGFVNPHSAWEIPMLWSEESGLVLLNNANEYEFIGIGGVSNLGLIAACYDQSDSCGVVLWRADKPQQEPVHLNDAIVDRPGGLYFWTMKAPIANDNSIMATGYRRLGNYKRYLLRPTKND